MGCGRSGSTILDILLGNSSQIESVGELVFALSRADVERCSCGLSLSDCTFWSRVRCDLEAEGIGWGEVCGMLDRGAAGVWRVWRAGHTDPGMVRRARDYARARSGNHYDCWKAACARLGKGASARVGFAPTPSRVARNPSCAGSAFHAAEHDLASPHQESPQLPTTNCGQARRSIILGLDGAEMDCG